MSDECLYDLPEKVAVTNRTIASIDFYDYDVYFTDGEKKSFKILNLPCLD